MQVLMNTGGIAATNCILIADETARQAVVFDAPDHTVGPLLDKAQQNGWEVVGLWLTHGHFDHVADHEAVTRRFPGARVLIHELEEEKLRHPEEQVRQFMLPFGFPARRADAFVTDNQMLHIGNIQVRVMHTPGHAAGHVVFHLPGEKILVGGDLIIGGSIGRTDLPDSNYAQLQASIRRVMQIPGDTTLLGGHGPPTTLADERQNNPYVQQAIEGAGESR